MRLKEAFQVQRRRLRTAAQYPIDYSRTDPRADRDHREAEDYRRRDGKLLKQRESGRPPLNPRGPTRLQYGLKSNQHPSLLVGWIAIFGRFFAVLKDLLKSSEHVML